MAEREAEELLEKEGFPVIPHAYATSMKEALECAGRLKYPVVLKISSSKILHKTEVGGIRLDLRNDKELKEAFAELRKIKFFEGVLVQKFMSGDQLLVGLQCDPVFGHVIGVGSGGIYTEILKDVTFRVCPVGEDEALRMLQEIKMYEVLKGARKKKPADLNKITEFVARLSKLVEKFPYIQELDVNPLLVSGSSVVIADARIILNSSVVVRAGLK